MIARLADWLGRHQPAAYGLVRPPWRALMRLAGRRGYWEDRRHFRYYEEVVRLAATHVPAGGRVLDVGAHETELVERLAWFRERVALDVRYLPPRPGVHVVTMDFMEYLPAAAFDLVLCLQVLEHVADPAGFAGKLMQTGRTVIVSVPHRWPTGTSPRHRHDPVDADKLEGWTRRAPLAVSRVSDGKERLIAVYAGDVAPG